MERVLGIDLGTTNSVVAYFEQGQPVVIPNAEGAKTTPSVVFYKSPQEIIVGELAKRHFVTHPNQVIRSVKRFMGARYSELGDKRHGVGYNLVEGPNDSVLIDVGWTRVKPEHVSAEILRKMKRTAEDFFGEEVLKAVVTVPAYFNDNQRQATKYAGELAGFEVLRIINEPTAAALAYGVDKNVQQRVAVFDLGGGTFDVSVLELTEEVFEVRSTRGDTFLGGDNFDEILLDRVMSRFYDETGVDLAADLTAFQRLRESAEKVKCELSTTTQSLIGLPFIAGGADGPVHLNQEVTRWDFEEMIATVMPRLVECCKTALVDAGLESRDIHHVLLVGGSTRIPAVQTLVKDYFGREPNRSLNPDEAVAVGAAIQGAILTGGLREVLLLDVTPLSLGIELAGGVFSVLLPRNSSIPTSIHKSFTTVRDRQSVVKVHVFQGERKKAAENHSLGHFRLTGITPAPVGIPAIDVCFQIDANGILHVSATDATSGVSKGVTIEGFGTVTEDEAEKIVKTAEEAADTDRIFMRLAFLRSQADAVLQQLNTALEEDPDSIEPEFARAVREAAFKFDLAASAGATMETDMAFARLKELGNELAGRVLVMRSHKKE